MTVVLVIQVDRQHVEDITEYEPVAIFATTELAVEYLKKLYFPLHYRESVDLIYHTNGASLFANYPFSVKFVLEFNIKYKFMKPSSHFYVFLETKVLDESSLPVPPAR